jgi:hypothetical protein
VQEARGRREADRDLGRGRTDWRGRMLNLLGGMRGTLRVKRAEGWLLWLHSRATPVTLVGFSLVLAARQFVGNPIECDHSKDIPSAVLDTFCWIHSTYTIPASFGKKVGIEVPYPGVDHSKGRAQTKVYRFYQWVAFLLFFQVISNFIYFLYTHYYTSGSRNYTLPSSPSAIFKIFSLSLIVFLSRSILFHLCIFFSNAILKSNLSTSDCKQYFNIFVRT